MMCMKAACLVVLCVALVDAKLYFANGTSFSTITDNEGADSGSWTDWINTDDAHGTGDYESIRAIRHYTQCDLLWCTDPRVMEVEIADSFIDLHPQADADEIFHCQNIYRRKVGVNMGFKCYRYMQQNSTCQNDEEMCMRNGLTEDCSVCADYKVRFFCLESDRTTDPAICQVASPFKRRLSHALQALLQGRSLRSRGNDAYDLLEDLDMAQRELGKQ